MGAVRFASTWAEGFADKIFVSRESLRLIQARGGGR